MKRKNLLITLLLIFIILFSFGCRQQEENTQDIIQSDLIEEKEELLAEREKLLEEREELLIEREELLKDREAKLEEMEKVQLDKLENNDASNDNNETKQADVKNDVSNYDKLPMKIKVHLVTTVVDSRAMTDGLQGYELYYNLIGDKLFVHITSGAGLGHPWFLIKIDSETITPIGGVASVTVESVEDVSVDPTPIPKENLYSKYIENKTAFDSGQDRVEEDSSFTMDTYEELRSYIQ